MNLSNYKDTFSPRTETNSFLSSLTLIRVILVLISRAGFILLQFGSVPTENFYGLLLQNIVELSVSLTSYGLLGSVLSFGSYSWKGIIGYGPWSHCKLDLDNIVLGFCAVLVGSAVVTTFLSSRLHFLGCAILAFVYAGFFQPLLMHWMWHKDGWMNNMELGNESVEISDHGGGLVIHVSSSCVGLMGVAFLGRRLLRLNYIDDCSLGAETPSTILVGYIFIILGLIGLSLPTKLHHPHHNYSVALINDFLSLAGGSLAAIVVEFVLCRDTFNYWVILRCIQGCVSALIITSSSVDVSNPPISFGVTLILTIVLNLSSKFIYKSSLEDYCNLLTVHLQSGIWSSLLQPFVVYLSTFQQVNFYRTLMKFSWHIICTLTVVSVTTLFFGCVFLLLCCTGFLRNKIEDNCHRRSHKLSRNFQECPLRRFFLLSKSDVVLEPGGSGKIAESSQPDLEVTYLEDELPARPKKSIFTEKTATLEQTGDAEIKDSPNENVSTKRKRKAKNIYTMKNVPLSTEIDAVLNCGDTGDFTKIYKLEDLIKQKSEILSEGKTNTNTSRIRKKLTKRISQHKLNKSKQFGNLSKNGREKKRRMINRSNSKTSQLVSDLVGQNLITPAEKRNEEIFTTPVPISKCF